MEPGILSLWTAFVCGTPLSPTVVPTVTSFGDTPDTQTRLADLVVAGAKRATASLLRAYGDEPLPNFGAFFVVVDGEGVPRCVCRITSVEVRPFSAVDGAFATEEGESTLECWQAAHRAFFQRQAADDGFIFDDGAELVLEKFEVVYLPAAPADPSTGSG